MIIQKKIINFKKDRGDCFFFKKFLYLIEEKNYNVKSENEI